jgi:predicted ArsR family transcriptional regulator
MRGRILEILKTTGEATAAGLGASLGISSVGVRQHLLRLERDGLVRHRPVRNGRGRPSHVFELTEVANEAFPQRYSDLLLTLIEAIRTTSGEQGLTSLFDTRTEIQEERYRADLEGKSLVERVEALAGIRDAEGYMAEAVPDGGSGWLLRERNCAIRAVAECCAEVCRGELELFQEVLPEADVIRLEHIASGDAACVYRIRPKT